MLRGFARLYDQLRTNSDFYPVLGLNAPRTRFKHQNADHLLELPHQPTLMLEMLGVRAAMHSKLEPSNLNHFPAELVTKRARAIGAILRGEEENHQVAGLQPGRSTAPGLLLKSAVPYCGKPWTKQQIYVLASRMREVVDLTMAFLAPEHMKGVWIAPQWIDCASMPDEIKRTLKLLEAMASRDTRKMEATAREWLDNRPHNAVLDEEFAPVAYSAMSLALAQQEKWGDVAAMEDQYGTKVKSTGGYQRQRWLLNAMAFE
jgi:spermidine synthase